ncbi:hypothetical protein BU25DRAFT_471692 [Macroventuria anomochaeta]|uniref:Uncharacterized protein n=1 Tax=Macroventuria anomochaeta TaxID=301207 RepID=A0ACB6RZW0_9PLEO|nr:uncharacterized protein BU25DRAFT_471692 [Macroventuria anomochaeta]KAF2626699.1 hypothetical protein BU25DRAFT_471692 [Macroventuria anomochaeta]
MPKYDTPEAASSTASFQTAEPDWLSPDASLTASFQTAEEHEQDIRSPDYSPTIQLSRPSAPQASPGPDEWTCSRYKLRNPLDHRLSSVLLVGMSRHFSLTSLRTPRSAPLMRLRHCRSATHRPPPSVPESTASGGSTSRDSFCTARTRSGSISSSASTIRAPSPNLNLLRADVKYGRITRHFYSTYGNCITYGQAMDTDCRSSESSSPGHIYSASASSDASTVRDPHTPDRGSNIRFDAACNEFFDENSTQTSCEDFPDRDRSIAGHPYSPYSAYSPCSSYRLGSPFASTPYNEVPRRPRHDAPRHSRTEDSYGNFLGPGRSLCLLSLAILWTAPSILGVRIRASSRTVSYFSSLPWWQEGY